VRWTIPFVACFVGAAECAGTERIPVLVAAPQPPWLAAPGPLTLEVDWSESVSPDRRALELLASTLERYAAREVDLVLDDRIPAEATRALASRADLARLTQPWLDLDPARGPLLWVLYLPRSEPLYGPDHAGMADTVAIERDGVERSIPVILVFDEGLTQDAVAWITRRKVERATLVHEAGHHLGLVSNPAHAQPHDPHHCTHAGCVMNRPRLSDTLWNALPALLAGKIPLDYCKSCREDLARLRWGIRGPVPGG
jgi:hypothetical protein